MRTNDSEERWIFHLALGDEWRDAVDAGVYERSTLGRSLADQGFIHCSFARQVQSIADLLYARRADDVVLLRIDRRRLAPEVRVENLDGGDDHFPHIYGPLAIDAVARVDPVPVGADGRLLAEELVGGAG